jgi:alcohol dehydrogenase
MQYAKGAGFETIAVSHSPDKDKMIRDLGADEVGATARALRQLGADVILSTSNSTKSMVDSTRADGRTVDSSRWTPMRSHFRSR